LKFVEEIRRNCNFIDATNGSILLYKLFKCRLLKRLTIRVPMRKLPKYESGMLSDLGFLWLEGCFVGEDSIPTLEKLPNLAVLVLRPNGFVGEELICSSIGFPNLKVIYLRGLRNLKKWRIDEGAMPNLSEVFIWECSKLEMIPDGMKFLKGLRMLDTYKMPRVFNDRIRVVNGEEGADLHKVCHVPLISLEGMYNTLVGLTFLPFVFDVL
jgi:hypothetical protein